jgi:hypothetical protein
MFKNGFYPSGKQRWRCKKCGTSKKITKENIVKDHELKLFLDWLLNSQPMAKISNLTTRGFIYKFSWCWNIIPKIPITNDFIPVLHIDGTYIKRDNCLLIAKSNDYVIGFLWCEGETEQSYAELLSHIDNVGIIVTDGNPGCLAAISKKYGDKALIQRCLFHIFMFARIKLSLQPKTEAGIELLKLVKELLHIQTIEQSIIWDSKFNNWDIKYKDFINEKTKIEKTDHSLHKRKWWFTHKSLRAVRTHIKKAISSEQLFTYLTNDCPNTNNVLEGGVNAALKRLRRAHNGFSIEHQKRLFEWYLWSRSKKSSLKEVL